MLNAILTGRGPGAISKALDWMGSILNRLISPTDPIISQGALDPVSTTTTTAPPAAVTGSGSPKTGQPSQTTKPTAKATAPTVVTHSG